MVKKLFLPLIMASFLGSCATYRFAEKVKVISFDDGLKKGKSIGPIRGEDCTWTVLGYKLGGNPTLDKAFINARKQSGALGAATGMGSSGEDALRYINNVTTSNDGFNAVVVAKQCLVVTGNGYK